MRTRKAMFFGGGWFALLPSVVHSQPTCRGGHCGSTDALQLTHTAPAGSRQGGLGVYMVACWSVGVSPHAAVALKAIWCWMLPSKITVADSSPGAAAVNRVCQAGATRKRRRQAGTFPCSSSSFDLYLVSLGISTAATSQLRPCPCLSIDPASPALRLPSPSAHPA